MLSRPATKIPLTADDVAAYEQRQLARKARNKSQELGDFDDYGKNDSTPEMTPAEEARAVKAKMSRDQRIGVGGSREYLARLFCVHDRHIALWRSHLLFNNLLIMVFAHHSLRAASLIAFIFLLYTLLPTAQADLHVLDLDDSLNVPLSSSEMRFELNDAGSPKLGPRIEKYDYLAASEMPADSRKLAKRYGSGEPFWFSQIKRQGQPAYGRNATYQVFRNVLDYGAKGDGITDDTDAFNAAIADGNRCGWMTGGYIGGTQTYGGYYGCDSQTTTPAIVYVPGGRTYMISSPVIMLYMTQMVGDANDLPVVKATADFSGIGIFDSDPYIIYQTQYYQNQNNFYRHVRNFVFDTTGVPPTTQVHGLHWQVAQAASLQNLVFNMPVGTPGDGNMHIGIFMDNGSSQFFEDIIFIGGQYGFFAGNQQMNIRNLTFYGCETGIYQNWGWIFVYKDITFHDCGIGLDMTGTPHSVTIQDSDFYNTPIAMTTNFSDYSVPPAANSLAIDNCFFDENTPIALASANGSTIVTGNRRVEGFVQGTSYTAYDTTHVVGNMDCYGPQTVYSRVQQEQPSAPKAAELLNSEGKFPSRGRPQYEGVPVEQFKSIMDYGCSNDGVTDVTTCVQNFLNSIDIAGGEIAFIDHGAYVITDTITVPNGIRMIGEIWPLFMVSAEAGKFQDQFNPQAAFLVGQPGDRGDTEIVEILFETRGPVPGAIMMQWNLECTGQISCGVFDSHWRVGGSNGTQLQNYNCIKQPNVAHGADPSCWVSFMLVHIAPSARNVIFSHNWLWVADHELDLDGKDQIDIYNGRGMLIESQGPFWMYGPSNEHSVLYNTQIANAKNIYLSMAQSETAYMQSNPNSLSSFTPQTAWSDPTFEDCFSARCFKTLGLRIYNSSYVYNYGSGLYSFFENYDSACITTHNCDERRVVIDKSEAVYMYNMNSIAASFLFDVDGTELVPYLNNQGTFADTVAFFEYP
ncbi:Glucan 1,3-beta-glucosidase [Lecanosticta acicola]|uniref:Glucan 1,3-beta-glucosidase n=1 Tax=Lecanosticta acicola TaxID=111012 RepID=A0AAI8Z1S5_9PEZI|nr:Glucan 1,3-beta-glucosidase [Lecanosticta acicola]